MMISERMSWVRKRLRIGIEWKKKVLGRRSLEQTPTLLFILKLYTISECTFLDLSRPWR